MLNAGSTVDPRDLSVQGYCTFTDNTTMRATDSRDLDLILTDIAISDPVARRFEVTIPGKDNALDLTEALGGVYFDRRTVTLQFRCINWTPQRHWYLASQLRNLLDGRKMRVTTYDDPAYFWLGRCSVESERPNGMTSDITVTVDADAHKYSVEGSYDAWKWSPFSFVDGVITQVADVVLNNQTKTVMLPKDPARGKPTLWFNTGDYVHARTNRGNWHQLKRGANTYPDIRMSDAEETTLYLMGTGTVGVDYRLGSL
jgi:hypothetical protein